MSNDRRQSDQTAPCNFDSTRATPKATRARHSDRSGSPQWDRQSSGRYERNEGERHEQAYDSYKPGQSPSRDMIPGPVRTSSTITSPFSPYIPSPYTDPRRPSSVRSPSNSSSNRQPDCPVVSRNNTASEQPPRLPEVGISILGRAAKAEQERKQREEEARIHNAKLDQRPGPALRSSSTIEMAPIVASSRSSWEGRAEATDGEQNVSSESGKDSTATQLFGESLKMVIDEMTEMSSLKSRCKSCKKKLDKAVSGFEKARDHHEKFPSVKDQQVNTKKAAEKEYNKAKKEIEQKDAALHHLATVLAEQVVPSILSASSNSGNEEQKTKERMHTLEKTCDKYDKLFREQKAYFEDQRRKSTQETDRKMNELKGELVLMKAEVAKEKPRQDKFFLQQNHFANLLKTLSNDLGKAKETITTLSIALPKLEQQLQKLEGLDQVRKNLTSLDIRSTIQGVVGSLSTTVNTLTNSVGSLEATSRARDTVVQTLTEEQNKLRKRVMALESSSVWKALDARLTRIEKGALPAAPSPSVAPLAATTNQLEASESVLVGSQLAALEEKLKPLLSQLSRFEDFENIKATVSKLKTDLSTTVDRLVKIEEGTHPHQKTNHEPHTVPDLTMLESRLTVVEQLDRQPLGSTKPDSSVEVRTLALEQERKQTEPLTTMKPTDQQSVSVQDFDNLVSQVNQLETAVQTIEAENACLLETAGEIVTEAVTSQSRPLENRMSAAESSLKSLQGSVKSFEDSYASVPASVESFEGSLKTFAVQIQNQDQAILDARKSLVGAAAGSAIEVIKSQNLFAPADLDEKFTSSLNHVTTNLMKHVEAQSETTGSLQYRMDNLNTSDLHRAIVDSVGQTFPNLRNCDMTLQSLSSQMSTTGINIKALQTQISELQESRQVPVPAPVPAPAPATSPAPASRQDSAALRALRVEVESHTTDLRKVKKLEKDFLAVSTTQTTQGQSIAEHASILEGQNKSITELGEQLAGKYFELQSSAEDRDARFESLNDKVKAVEQKVDEFGQKQQLQSHRAPSAPVLSRNAFRGPHSRQIAASVRPTSASSDTASVLGKRTRPTNGTPGPGSPRKANGFKQAGDNHRSSPAAKRTRRGKVEDDPDVDPDYEEGDPQPGISGDEDEDEEPRNPNPNTRRKSEKKVIDLVSD